MRRKTTLLGIALAVSAAFGIAAPASAAIPLCVGTQGTVVVCVDPTAGTLYDDCVYAGPPPCTQVTVPGPTVHCTGVPVTVQVLCALIRNA